MLAAAGGFAAGGVAGYLVNEAIGENAHEYIRRLLINEFQISGRRRSATATHPRTSPTS